MSPKTLEASVALILDDQFRILASTHPIAGWSLPGGKAEEGEDPKTTLMRELYEELGVIVPRVHLALVYSTMGAERHVHGFHVRAIRPYRPREGQRLRFMTFGEFLRSTAYAESYRRVLPDGVEHLRATRFL